MARQVQSTHLSETFSHGLVVIARDTTGLIITRISSNRDLLGAIHTAKCVLRLKAEAARVEVHCWEPPPTAFQKRPLAAFEREDLLAETIQ